jgi:hypothetical protein
MTPETEALLKKGAKHFAENFTETITSLAEEEMTLKERFNKILWKWLHDNVASEDAPNEWWGYDTMVGDLIKNADPLRDFTKETLSELRESVGSWKYQYTNYPTQMRTKKTFEKGEMAEELANEMLSLITTKLTEYEK